MGNKWGDREWAINREIEGGIKWVGTLWAIKLESGQ